MSENKDNYIEPLSIKVTKIGKKWHCRLFRLDKIHDETFCLEKSDIGRCCRDMLRWYDKMGWEPYSKWADWSRHNNEKSYRQNYTNEGKIVKVGK
jgi:hypothetical protein